MRSGRQKELFDEICDKLRATDETARAEVQKRIDKIGLTLERNKTAAETAKDAPTLGKARSQLDAEIEQTKKQIDIFNMPEAFLRYGATATDNRFNDPDIHQQSATELEDMFHQRRANKVALEKYLRILIKRRENQSWKTRGGKLTTHTMERGTPPSNFAADCIKIFEAFRPRELSWKEGGDLYIVAANIYELITDRSLVEENPDFSLEHYLKRAIGQFRETNPKI